MSKVVRYEFLGSWLSFWMASVTVVLIPVALLYLINGTIAVVTEMENPEDFVAAHRAG